MTKKRVYGYRKRPLPTREEISRCERLRGFNTVNEKVSSVTLDLRNLVQRIFNVSTQESFNKPEARKIIKLTEEYIKNIDEIMVGFKRGSSGL